MTRRGFLQAALAAPFAAAWVARLAGRAGQGLDRFTAGTATCGDDKPTTAVPDDQTFRAGAPERTALADRDASGQRLTISGTVSGVVCGPIKGARVEFWQADAHGVYDVTGFRLRGYQLTDTDGRYHVETIVPAAAAGRARHVNARVQATGKPGLTTALYFPDDPDNSRDPIFRPELTMKTTPAPGGLAATFNFVLNA